MAKSAKKSTEFRVILDGLKLPQEMQNTIETEIKKVVMKQIATIDFQGDLVVSPLGADPRSGNGGPTQGIHIHTRVGK